MGCIDALARKAQPAQPARRRRWRQQPEMPDARRSRDCLGTIAQPTRRARRQAQVNGQAREREGGRGGGVCVVGQGGAGGRVCKIYKNCDAKRPAMQGAQRTSDPPGLTPKTATMRHEMPHAKPPGHMTEAATATGHILATGKHSRMPRPTHARTARRRRRNWSCAGGKRLRRRRATLHLPPCASSH